MNDFIFDHYVGVAQLTIVGALPVMFLGILVTGKAGRLRAATLAMIAYLAIVALGMSGNLKHLSLVGVAHALIAFWIAAIATRSIRMRFAMLLWVPCVFIAVVVLYNLLNEGMGLELMGRWKFVAPPLGQVVFFLR